MPKFRQKPVVIDAVQFNPNHKPWHDEADWTAEHWPAGVRHTSYAEIAQLLGTSGCSKEPPYWDWSVLGIIETLEGPHVVCPGDWVITGVKGERYPCRADIFAATYERVPDTNDDHFDSPT